MMVKIPENYYKYGGNPTWHQDSGVLRQR